MKKEYKHPYFSTEFVQKMLHVQWSEKLRFNVNENTKTNSSATLTIVGIAFERLPAKCTEIDGSRQRMFEIDVETVTVSCQR